MQYEFILSTGREINFFPLNQTINHNTCATTTPLHRLAKHFFFNIHTVINEKVKSQDELS